jgi:uncharacterized protein (DUF305 family)
MRSRFTAFAAVLLIVAVGGVAAACGTGSDHSAMGHDDAGTTHDGMSHNSEQMGTGREADVMFTQEMIPHHEQAVEMADLALDPVREASPAVQALAKRIKAAQSAEIVDMKAWLREWDAAATSEHMEHMGENGMGMMSTAQMTALSEATGAAFDRLWLEGMIEHHEGALMMASHIAERGEDPRVQQLSQAIDSSQTAEITEMKQLLDQ